MDSPSEISQQRTSGALRGVLWMVVTGLLFVSVTALVKSLGSRLPPAESAFLRYVLGLVFLLPLIRPILSSKMNRRSFALFSGRSVLHSLGLVTWFMAMTRLPIAEVSAMNYLVPIWTTLGAIVFLGERIAVLRAAAICLAFVGAMIILRPGLRVLDIAHLGMVFTTISFAGGYIIAKRLSVEFSPSVIVGMLSFMVPIFLAPMAFAHWVTPSLHELVVLFGVASFATAGHYTMTLAFRSAPMSVTQPVTFLQLVWSVLMGVLIFDEAIDLWVILGGTLIVAAVSFISWREARIGTRL